MEVMKSKIISQRWMKAGFRKIIMNGGDSRMKNCKDEYGDQYSNVIACSDRMVTEFVKWIQQQEKMIETACGGRIRSRKKNGSYQRFRYSDAVQPSIFLNTLLK